MDETLWEKLPAKILLSALAGVGTLIGVLWKLYFHPRIKSKQETGIAKDRAEEKLATQTAGIVSTYEKLWITSEERVTEREKRIRELENEINDLRRHLIAEQAKTMPLELRIEGLLDALNNCQTRVIELEHARKTQTPERNRGAGSNI